VKAKLLPSTKFSFTGMASFSKQASESKENPCQEDRGGSVVPAQNDAPCNGRGDQRDAIIESDEASEDVEDADNNEDDQGHDDEEGGLWAMVWKGRPGGGLFFRSGW